jgi:hypothetical protein
MKLLNIFLLLLFFRTVKLNSHIKIFVYDNKRFKPKQHGGMFFFCFTL